MILAVFAITFPAEAATQSGTCGDDLTWTFNDSTGVLTVSGTGAMTDFATQSHAPWYSYRSSITSVVINNGVTSVGRYSFSEYSAIKSISLSTSVTKIGYGAFYNCTGLTTITIPENVTTIESNAFVGCANVTSLNYDPSAKISFTALKLAFSGIGEDTTGVTVTFGANVTHVPDYMFYKSSGKEDNVTTVIFKGNKVTSVGEDAFYGCSTLKSINIPTSVTKIGYGAFYSCTGLTNATYCGTQAQWDAIVIDSYNTSLTDIIKIYGTHATKILQVISEATCTQMGENVQQCDRCQLIQTVYPSALGHSYSAWSVETPATCTTNGTEKAVCTRTGCTETKYADILATGHTYSAWERYNEAQHKRACECGYVEYADHEWDNGTVTTPATHWAEGVKTFTCMCGETRTETIAKTADHSYSVWQKYSGTQHKKVCECGDTVYADHIWNNRIVTTPATHTSEGVKTFSCACGETRTETIAKTAEHSYSTWQKHNDIQHKKACECGDTVYADHTWNGGEITTQPTQDSEGVKTYSCTECGETRTESVDKLPTVTDTPDTPGTDATTDTSASDSGNTENTVNTEDSGESSEENTQAVTHLPESSDTSEDDVYTRVPNTDFESSGCGGMLGSGAAIAVCAMAAAVYVKRKREDQT